MSFKSGVKGRGSDRWWERRWWLWWGDMRRMRWARRRMNTMRLTEWRRELIPKVVNSFQKFYVSTSYNVDFENLDVNVENGRGNAYLSVCVVSAWKWMNCWRRLSDRIETTQFRDLVSKLQKFVSCRLFPQKPDDLPPMKKCSWWIPCVTKVMALLSQ